MKDTRRHVVQFDSGWTSDGHTLCWSVDGAWFLHPEDCPYTIGDDDMRYYQCSPGIQEDTFGIFINDLPEDEFERCIARPQGSSPVLWRVREAFHPDMDDVQVEAVKVFEIKLDEEDERNDE